MPTLNTSNPLVTGLVFLAPFQENILPYTDDAGGRSMVATDATIQLTSPGPALAITAATTSKAQSSTTPMSAPPYTMAVIAYRTAVGTSSQVAFSWSRDDAEYVSLGFNSTPSFARIRGGGVIVDTSGQNCGANAWHNLALVVGSNTSRSLYTNGTMTSGGSTSVVVGGSYFTPLTVGALQRGSLGENLYTGYIKWTAIWNRALTQTELDTFFANPSALFVSASLAWSGTIAAQTSTVGTAISPLATSGYVSGGTTPYVYSTTGLPAGLSINSSTGSITGTPTTANAYSTTVIVTDSAGTPASVSSNTFTWTVNAAAATTITMTGPSGGQTGVASANFTLGANGAISGSHVVTPSSGGGGGTFTPSTVTLTAGSPTGVFTYTPSSTGVKTIIATDAGGYTAPSSLSYTSSAASGVFTSEILKDNTGAPIVSQALTHFTLYDNTTGALIVRRTGLSTNSSGIVSFSDGALLAGTTYKADWLTSAGHYRMPSKAAT